MPSSASRLIVPTGLVLGAVGLLASSVPLFRSNLAVSEVVEAREVTFRVLDDLRQLTGSVESSEALQRGYLLTGDPADLQRFRGRRAEALRVLAALRASAAGVGVPGGELVPRVDSLANRRIALLDSVASVRASEGTPAALRAVVAGGGTQVMADLRATVDSIVATIEGTLAMQDRALAAELARGRTTVIVGSGASLLLILAMLGLLGRQRTARRSAEAALLAANDELTKRNEELSESEASLERQGAVLEGILYDVGVGVVVTDADGEFLLFNPQAERILGRGETHGGPPVWPEAYGLFRPDEDTTYSPDDLPLARALRGEAVQDVTIVQRRADRESWLVMSARPLRLPDGTLIGGFAAFTDVTSQKEVEGELRRSKAEAERASRVKGEFLANMSHEIRTPLNGVVGMVDLALQTDDEIQRTRYMQGALSASNGLLEIINDILDYSKIEAGHVEAEQMPFRLRGTIEDVLESFVGTAQKKRIELVSLVMPDVPDALIGDPGRIRQVLRNLVSNALKFTDSGAVLVRVDTKSEESGRVGIDLSVIDTGIGIPPELQAKIFEPFQQADASTTRRFGGTGLGLTIVAQAVELMDGRIWLESEPGRGSAFHVELELRLDDRYTAGDSVPVDLDGERVLIVDDHELSRLALQASCTA